MSLTGLVAAYAEFVAAAVEDATGDPPDQVIRYHGGPVPDSCCTEKGVVSAWVAPVQATVAWPVPATFRDKLNGAFQLVNLHAKWATCWDVPGQDPNGNIVPDYAAWDVDAGRLLIVCETVTCQLIELSCRPEGDIADDIGCGLFRFVGANPNDMNRAGGCAGWTWDAVAGLTCPAPTVS